MKQNSLLPRSWKLSDFQNQSKSNLLKFIHSNPEDNFYKVITNDNKTCILRQSWWQEWQHQLWESQHYHDHQQCSPWYLCSDSGPSCPGLFSVFSSRGRCCVESHSNWDSFLWEMIWWILLQIYILFSDPSLLCSTPTEAVLADDVVKPQVWKTDQEVLLTETSLWEQPLPVPKVS